MKLAPAHLQHYFFPDALSVLVIVLPRLRGRDDLLGFLGFGRAQVVFVPVRFAGLFLVHLPTRRTFVSVRLDERNGYLGHAQRSAFAGSGKDDVFHLAAAQRLRALLAQYPAHAVQNVRFAAAVRPHHRRDACAAQGQFGLIAKRLEAENLNFFKLQQGLEPLLCVGKGSLNQAPKTGHGGRCSAAACGYVS